MRGCNSISELPSTSFNTFNRQRVKERLHKKQEKISIAKTFTTSNENEEVEEIEGNIIPSWLMNDEEEIDNDKSMLDDISIKIEGGTY